ncbi:DgyrCDS8511 [Dimorphilus gyrociliatus]|uniref:DgyrCDS8511 n=1 Tax=Dimorphilus gyrociliatus TaxID=2664684 RepID=A0A7I8VUE8_9ANNE|nr:DgyrCDS8511 [Dimorphilus gyrociliatus]
MIHQEQAQGSSGGRRKKKEVKHLDFKHEEGCCSCGKGDRLTFCEKCPASIHGYCMNPPQTDPLSWLCSKCQGPISVCKMKEMLSSSKVLMFQNIKFDDAYYLSRKKELSLLWQHFSPSAAEAELDNNYLADIFEDKSNNNDKKSRVCSSPDTNKCIKCDNSYHLDCCIPPRTYKTTSFICHRHVVESNSLLNEKARSITVEKSDLNDITKQFCEKLCKEYKKLGAITIQFENKKESFRNPDLPGSESYFRCVIERLDDSRTRQNLLKEVLTGSDLAVRNCGQIIDHSRRIGYERNDTEIVRDIKLLSKREEQQLKEEAGNQFYDIIKFFIKKESLCCQPKPSEPEKREIWKKIFQIILRLEKIAQTLNQPPKEIKLYLDSLPNLEEFETTDGDIHFIPKSSLMEDISFNEELTNNNGSLNCDSLQQNSPTETQFRVNMTLNPIPKNFIKQMDNIEIYYRFRYGRQKVVDKKGLYPLKTTDASFKAIMEEAHTSGYSISCNNVVHCVEVSKKDNTIVFNERVILKFVRQKFRHLFNDLKNYEEELGLRLKELIDQVDLLFEEAELLDYHMTTFFTNQFIWNITRYICSFSRENSAHANLSFIDRFESEAEILIAFSYTRSKDEFTKLSKGFNTQTNCNKIEHNVTSNVILNVNVMEDNVIEWNNLFQEIYDYLLNTDSFDLAEVVSQFKQRLMAIDAELKNLDFQAYHIVQNEFTNLTKSFKCLLFSLNIHDKARKGAWIKAADNMIKLKQLQLKVMALNQIPHPSFHFHNSTEKYKTDPKNLKLLVATTLEHYILEKLKKEKYSSHYEEEKEFVREFSNLLRSIFEDIYLTDLEKINKMSTLEMSDKEGILSEVEFTDEERRLFEYFSNTLNSRNAEEEREYIKVFGLSDVDVKSVEWVIFQQCDKRNEFRRLVTNSEDQTFFVGDAYTIEDLKEQLNSTWKLAKRKFTLYENLKCLSDDRENVVRDTSSLQNENEKVQEYEEHCINSVAEDIHSFLESQEERFPFFGTMNEELLLLEYSDEEYDKVMLSLSEIIENTGKGEEEVKNEIAFEKSREIMYAFNAKCLSDADSIIALETEVQAIDADYDMDGDDHSLEIVDMDMKENNTTFENSELITSESCVEIKGSRKPASYLLIISEEDENNEEASSEYIANLMEYVKNEYGKEVLDNLLFLHILGLKLTNFISFNDNPDIQKLVRILIVEYLEDSFFNVKISNCEEQGLYFIQGCNISKFTKGEIAKFESPSISQFGSATAISNALITEELNKLCNQDDVQNLDDALEKLDNAAIRSLAKESLRNKLQIKQDFPKSIDKPVCTIADDIELHAYKTGMKRLYAILLNTNDLTDWLYIMDPTVDLFISKYDGKLRVKRPGEKYVENTHGTLLLVDMEPKSSFYDVTNLKHGSVLQFFEGEKEPIEYIFFQVNLLEELGDILRSQTFGNIMIRFKEKYNLDGREYAKNFMEYDDIRRKWVEEDSQFLELMNIDLCPFKSRIRKHDIAKTFDEKISKFERTKNKAFYDNLKRTNSKTNIVHQVTDLNKLLEEKCFYDIKLQKKETNEDVKIIASTHIEINEMDSIPNSPENSDSHQIDLLRSACISSGVGLGDSS